MHFYLGNIEKVKFFDAKVTYGKGEPENSQGYKVHVANVINKHPWLKATATKEQKDNKKLVGIKLFERQAEDVMKSNTHL